MIRKLNLILAFALLMLPLAGLAQQMDAFDLHVASLRVLEDKDVQKELAITTVQRNKMDKFAEDYNAQLKAYVAELKKQKKDPPMPDQTVVMKLTKLKKDVMGLLKPEQLKRLREISLQAFGLNGILDKAVAKKVGLSDDQYNRISKTYKDGSQKANNIMVKAMEPVKKQFSKKPKTDAERKKMQADYIAKGKEVMNSVMDDVKKVNNDTQSAMIAIFTPQQKQAFLALQGKSFDAKKAN